MEFQDRKIIVVGRGVCAQCGSAFMGEAMICNLKIKEHIADTGHDFYNDAKKDYLFQKYIRSICGDCLLDVIVDFAAEDNYFDV